MRAALRHLLGLLALAALATAAKRTQYHPNADNNTGEDFCLFVEYNVGTADTPDIREAKFPVTRHYTVGHPSGLGGSLIQSAPSFYRYDQERPRSTASLLDFQDSEIYAAVVDEEGRLSFMLMHDNFLSSGGGAVTMSIIPPADPVTDGSLAGRGVDFTVKDDPNDDFFNGKWDPVTATTTSPGTFVWGSGESDGFVLGELPTNDTWKFCLRYEALSKTPNNQLLQFALGYIDSQLFVCRYVFLPFAALIDMSADLEVVCITHRPCAPPEDQCNEEEDDCGTVTFNPDGTCEYVPDTDLIGTVECPRMAPCAGGCFEDFQCITRVCEKGNSLSMLLGLFDGIMDPSTQTLIPGLTEAEFIELREEIRRAAAEEAAVGRCAPLDGETCSPCPDGFALDLNGDCRTDCRVCRHCQRSHYCAPSGCVERKMPCQPCARDVECESNICWDVPTADEPTFNGPSVCYDPTFDINPYACQN